MVSVMTASVTYSINMDIFNPQTDSHSLSRIDTPSFQAWQISAQTEPQPDPVSATSTVSADSWTTNGSPPSNAQSSHENAGIAYQYAQGYDRPWLFSPPSGFRKGLKKTDLRPVDAPTKPRSQLPKAGKRDTPYARPEPTTNTARRRGSSSGGSVQSAKASPSPEQLIKLEKRRRANAEAQRLSRQRKEETLQALREEVEGLSQRAALLREDLQQLRLQKERADQLLHEETARAGQLQVEIERRRSLRRRQAQGSFMQLQAEQGMTPMIGLTPFPNTFWA